MGLRVLTRGTAPVFCGMFGLTMALALAQAPFDFLLSMAMRSVMGVPMTYTAS
jgi:hypothetical protein